MCECMPAGHLFTNPWMITPYTEMARLARGCDASDASLQHCSGISESGREQLCHCCGSATDGPNFSIHPCIRRTFVLALEGLLQPYACWGPIMAGSYPLFSTHWLLSRLRICRTESCANIFDGGWQHYRWSMLFNGLHRSSPKSRQRANSSY